jgi:inhibitor of cysteine peptidase
MKAIFAWIAGLALTGCTTSRLSEHPRTLTEEEDGRRIAMQVGETLVVRLPSNPSTGYGWVNSSSGETTLRREIDGTYQPGPRPEGVVGSGGTEVWQFRVIHVGRESLRFEYQRPWEKATPPAKVVTYIIDVTTK